MRQYNNVGKVKETVTVIFKNGYSITLNEDVEVSMSLTVNEKNVETEISPDGED